MKKRLSILILMLLSALSFVCAEDFWIADDGPNTSSEYKINFSFAPFTGSSGINMRSDFYPQYDVKYPDGFKWVGSGLSALNKNEYCNENIVAMASVYGISRWYNKNLTSDTTQKEPYTMHSVDSIILKITADCASGFNFVSQSNPSIVRPFTLFIYPKYCVNQGIESGFTNDHNPIFQNENLISLTPPYDNTKEIVLNGESVLTSSDLYFWNKDQANYLNIWFDVIVSLPLDENGVSQQGVIAGGKLYPLVDASDYSALVTLTLELTLRYKQDNGTEINEVKFTKTLPIPFSGYSSALGANEPDKSAIYINTTTANINLNPNYTGRWVNIGSINYEQYLGSAPVSSTDEKSKIFFSASSDPFVPNTNGFRFIHSKAGKVLTSNNSVPFTLRFTGTGYSSGDGSVEFDGRGYTSSSNMMGGIEGNSILSTCHNDENFAHSVVGRVHFHSIDGDLSIMVDDNPDTMQAGTYYADVYVHVIAED